MSTLRIPPLLNHHSPRAPSSSSDTRSLISAMPFNIAALGLPSKRLVASYILDWIVIMCVLLL